MSITNGKLRPLNQPRFEPGSNLSPHKKQLQKTPSRPPRGEEKKGLLFLLPLGGVRGGS